MSLFAELVVKMLKLDATTRGANIFATYGKPVNGVSGTGAGEAETYSWLLDTANGIVYENTNTKASPTWTNLYYAQGSLSTSHSNSVSSSTSDSASKAAL